MYLLLFGWSHLISYLVTNNQVIVSLDNDLFPTYLIRVTVDLLNDQKSDQYNIHMYG